MQKELHIKSGDTFKHNPTGKIYECVGTDGGWIWYDEDVITEAKKFNPDDCEKVSPTPISPYWDEVAKQLYPPSMSNVLFTHQREAFLKGASMQQLWVPVKSGVFPKEGSMILVATEDNFEEVFHYKIVLFGVHHQMRKTTKDFKGKFYYWEHISEGGAFRIIEPTHWRYITHPGSNTNPIVENYLKLLKENEDLKNKIASIGWP